MDRGPRGREQTTNQECRGKVGFGVQTAGALSLEGWR